MTLRNLAVDSARIAEDVEILSKITEPDRPWTRRVFTPLFLEGRAYVQRRMQSAGLETRIDAAGNLIGRRAGRVPGLGVIMVGSHTDTVPDGGRFDGIAGVAAGLEVARALRDHGVELDHDLEIVDFLAEEVSPYGVSCIGSRGMTGQMPADWLTRVKDGVPLAQAIDGVGGEAGAVMGNPRKDIAAFLELHIEQGPILETERLDIGLVTAICGITRFEIVLEGRADHAGTTPMDARADALVAASQLVLDIREAAQELSRTPGHFTATVGEFTMEPNAANVVPSRVRLLIDARAELRPDMERFAAWLDGAVARRATGGVTASAPVRISDSHPAPGDPGLIDALEAACARIGAGSRKLASGAGHDTAWLSRVTRGAMIFVPSKGGRSHCADEWTENDEIALGTAVLYETVIAVDKERPGKENVDGTHTG